jgi:hypothetical protein
VITKLAAIEFGDPQLALFHKQTRDAIDVLSLIPFTDGTQVDFGAHGAAGLLTFQHRLGRVPKGFLVLSVRIPGGATAVPALARRTGEVWNKTVAQLYCSALFDALSLWVF